MTPHGQMANQQRLEAVLAADACGYSKLMGDDEAATLAALDAAREVFRSQVSQFGGRVVDMAGDSVLAVFESAAGAVRAALAVQNALGGVPDAPSAARRLRFRIGVHLADLVEKPDGTVYGDGVNVAAWLQALAPPGGIAVSDAVRGAVQQRVDAWFEDIGTRTVENIRESLRVHAIHATQGSSRARVQASLGRACLSLLLRHGPARAAVRRELRRPEEPSSRLRSDSGRLITSVRPR